MPWDGVERRKACMLQGNGSSFCAAHVDFVAHLAEIRGSLNNIEKGLVEDTGFKRGIITAFIGVFMTIVFQIAGFAFLWGGVSRQVEINTGRLNIIEEQHRMFIKREETLNDKR